MMMPGHNVISTSHLRSLLNTKQIFTAAKCQFSTRTLQLCKQANTPSPHLTLSQRNELQYADTDFYWFQLRGNRDRSWSPEWLLSKQYRAQSLSLDSHLFSQPASYLTRETQWVLYKKFPQHSNTLNHPSLPSSLLHTTYSLALQRFSLKFFRFFHCFHVWSRCFPQDLLLSTCLLLKWVQEPGLGVDTV